MKYVNIKKSVLLSNSMFSIRLMHNVTKPHVGKRSVQNENRPIDYIVFVMEYE